MGGAELGSYGPLDRRHYPILASDPTAIVTPDAALDDLMPGSETLDQGDGGLLAKITEAATLHVASLEALFHFVEYVISWVHCATLAFGT
jgi:hypothetical protein